MNKNLFAALAILAIGCLASASAQTVQVNQQNRTIEIAATSSIQVTADRVTISAGYHNYGPTHDAAFAENARIAAHILKALTDAGIAQREIVTNTLTSRLVSETNFEICRWPIVSRCNTKLTSLGKLLRKLTSRKSFSTSR